MRSEVSRDATSGKHGGDLSLLNRSEASGDVKHESKPHHVSGSSGSDPGYPVLTSSNMVIEND